MRITYSYEYDQGPLIICWLCWMFRLIRGVNVSLEISSNPYQKSESSYVQARDHFQKWEISYAMLNVEVIYPSSQPGMIIQSGQQIGNGPWVWSGLSFIGCSATFNLFLCHIWNYYFLFLQSVMIYLYYVICYLLCSSVYGVVTYSFNVVLEDHLYMGFYNLPRCA